MNSGESLTPQHRGQQQQQQVTKWQERTTLHDDNNKVYLGPGRGATRARGGGVQFGAGGTLISQRSLGASGGGDGLDTSSSSTPPPPSSSTKTSTTTHPSGGGTVSPSNVGVKQNVGVRGKAPSPSSSVGGIGGSGWTRNAVEGKDTSEGQQQGGNREEISTATSSFPALSSQISVESTTTQLKGCWGEQYRVRMGRSDEDDGDDDGNGGGGGSEGRRGGHDDGTRNIRKRGRRGGRNIDDGRESPGNCNTASSPSSRHVYSVSDMIDLICICDTSAPGYPSLKDFTLMDTISAPALITSTLAPGSPLIGPEELERPTVADIGRERARWAAGVATTQGNVEGSTGGKQHEGKNAAPLHQVEQIGGGGGDAPSIAGATNPATAAPTVEEGKERDWGALRRAPLVIKEPLAKDLAAGKALRGNRLDAPFQQSQKRAASIASSLRSGRGGDESDGRSEGARSRRSSRSHRSGKSRRSIGSTGAGAAARKRDWGVARRGEFTLQVPSQDDNVADERVDSDGDGDDFWGDDDEDEQHQQDGGTAQHPSIDGIGGTDASSPSPMDAAHTPTEDAMKSDPDDPQRTARPTAPSLPVAQQHPGLPLQAQTGGGGGHRFGFALVDDEALPIGGVSGSHKGIPPSRAQLEKHPPDDMATSSSFLHESTGGDGTVASSVPREGVHPLGQTPGNAAEGSTNRGGDAEGRRIVDLGEFDQQRDIVSALGQKQQGGAGPFPTKGILKGQLPKVLPNAAYDDPSRFLLEILKGGGQNDVRGIGPEAPSTSVAAVQSEARAIPPPTVAASQEGQEGPAWSDGSRPQRYRQSQDPLPSPPPPPRFFPPFPFDLGKVPRQGPVNCVPTLTSGQTVIGVLKEPVSMTRPVWYYVDLHNSIQGPFTGKQLKAWGNFFSDNHPFLLYCTAALVPSVVPSDPSGMTYIHCFCPRLQFFGPNEEPFTQPVRVVPLVPHQSKEETMDASLHHPPTTFPLTQTRPILVPVSTQPQPPHLAGPSSQEMVLSLQTTSPPAPPSPSPPQANFQPLSSETPPSDASQQVKQHRAPTPSAEADKPSRPSSDAAWNDQHSQQRESASSRVASTGQPQKGSPLHHRAVNNQDQRPQQAPTPPPITQQHQPQSQRDQKGSKSVSSQSAGISPKSAGQSSQANRSQGTGQGKGLSPASPQSSSPTASAENATGGQQTATRPGGTAPRKWNVSPPQAPSLESVMMEDRRKEEQAKVLNQQQQQQQRQQQQQQQQLKRQKEAPWKKSSTSVASPVTNALSAAAPNAFPSLEAAVAPTQQKEQGVTDGPAQRHAQGAAPRSPALAGGKHHHGKGQKINLQELHAQSTAVSAAPAGGKWKARLQSVWGVSRDTTSSTCQMGPSPSLAQAMQGGSGKPASQPRDQTPPPVDKLRQSGTAKLAGSATPPTAATKSPQRSTSFDLPQSLCSVLRERNMQNAIEGLKQNKDVFLFLRSIAGDDKKEEEFLDVWDTSFMMSKERDDDKARVVRDAFRKLAPTK